MTDHCQQTRLSMRRMRSIYCAMMTGDWRDLTVGEVMAVPAIVPGDNFGTWYERCRPYVQVYEEASDE